jgi:SAM-dependent methyltransferase
VTDTPRTEPGRARSFGTVAGAYAAHRPRYATTAVDWALAPLDSRPITVLDLGAGTGKLTVDLVARPGTGVVAVEPDPEMLAELRAALPGVTALQAPAEDIPLAGGSVDAVLVGQAFHWFDTDRALPEIARVLRPGGVLAALWNYDDSAVDWVPGYHEAASRTRTTPGIPRGGSRPELPAHPAFAPSTSADFRHSLRLTVDGLIDLLGTHSWALIAEPAERDAAYARIRAYLATRPELGAEFELPIVSTVLRTLRR